MRLLQTFFALLLFTTIGTPDSIATTKKFPIIFVSGNISYDNNKPVKPGDRISFNSKLKFRSIEDFLLTIMEEHVVKLSQHSYRNEQFYTTNEFSCSQFIYNTLTSDSALFNPLNLLTDTLLFFKPNQPIFIDKKNFQLKDNNFLILQFEKANGSFTRKISFSGETIVLDKPSHFKQDSSLHNPKIKVLQYNSDKNSYHLLYSYYPFLISKVETEKILKSTYEILIKLFPHQNALIERYQNEVNVELIGICTGGKNK